MNQISDGSQSFDFNNLTLNQPTISEDLTLKQPAISNNLTIGQPAIGCDWLIGTQTAHNQRRLDAKVHPPFDASLF